MNYISPNDGDMLKISKFCKIHRKTPVLEFLLNKVAGLRLETLLAKRLN